MDRLSIITIGRTYKVTKNQISGIWRQLEKKYGGEDELLKQIKEMNQANSQKDSHSFRQNGFSCINCMHSKAKTGGSIYKIENLEKNGCNYRDSVIQGIVPSPPIHQFCTWLGLYRLALENNLLT
jgi:hypothetical protein